VGLMNPDPPSSPRLVAAGAVGLDPARCSCSAMIGGVLGPTASYRPLSHVVGSGRSCLAARRGAFAVNDLVWEITPRALLLALKLFLLGVGSGYRHPPSFQAPRSGDLVPCAKEVAGRRSR